MSNQDRSNRAISDLVISYSAYMDAVRRRVDHAIYTWAHCLIGDQERTGVVMVPYVVLREDIQSREDCLEEVF